MENCIRTLGVLTDGALSWLWNLYIQILAIVNKTADQYYTALLHIYWVGMNENVWTSIWNQTVLEPQTFESLPNIRTAEEG